jgi:DNA-binding response OmpR family regulator
MDPLSSTSERTKVLVVEDDAQLAHLYCTALALRGLAPTRAADGVAALRALEKNRPDFVLLDLMLPNVSGSTVLREFAANPLTNDIPIIVVTGVDPLPDLPHALMVLRKPCDPDHVAQIICDHVTKGIGR